jgi:hypothetical protein
MVFGMGNREEKSHVPWSLTRKANRPEVVERWVNSEAMGNLSVKLLWVGL